MVHATAVVDEPVQIGGGSKIWHFCHVMTGASIGRGCVLGQNVFVAGSVVMGDRCKVQNNVSLYDGVILGDDVFIGPSAVFTNVSRPRASVSRRDAFERTVVEDGVTIGANATIRCGALLEVGAFVAAGALVLEHVPSFCLVAGVPARPIGWACLCGERIEGAEFACGSCARRYERAGAGLRLVEQRP